MAPRRDPIAVVDDDARVLKALAALLHACGYRTELYASPAEFLNSAAASKAVCLVLDVNLGTHSGLELARHPAITRLRLPLVFMSGSAEDSIREQALAAGAVAFLRKPFRSGELLDALARASQASALQRRSTRRRRSSRIALQCAALPPGVCVIRKRANRRLLDIARNRYVNLADLRTLVMQRMPLVVIDKDGRDITRDTLLQVVIEHERLGHGVLTASALTQIIRCSERSGVNALGSYLEDCLRRWFDSQETTIS